MFPRWFIELCGWLPAIIFPGASFVQLWVMLRDKKADGVSPTAWSLFGLANICLYIYTEKYAEFQTLALLLTAVIEFAIVVLWYKLTSSKAKE